MNREYSQDIIEALLQWGVREFYVCAGARDIPLIEAVCQIQSPQTVVFHHFEERSAAFYALGRIKSLRQPVVIITTSGTAVGELLPAVMEAYYTGLPLVLLTADRPRSYRGSGAPQSAEQKGIFGIYVSKCFDLTPGDSFCLADIPGNQPVHINVCFDIPLQEGVLKPLTLPPAPALPKFPATIPPHGLQPTSLAANREHLTSFLTHHQNRLVVIVSQIFETNLAPLIDFLCRLNAPLYLEAISNLREVPALQHLQIKCGDRIWSHAQEAAYPIDAVLKIGGTPTHRFWRDLDEHRQHIRILSVSSHIFAGIPQASHIYTNLSSFFSDFPLLDNKNSSPEKNKFLQLDQSCYEKMCALFTRYPQAEQALFYALSQKIKADARVYLGNSLPIRHWDLCATYESKNICIDASRGLNGIDGQISSFLGFAQESASENWGIFGDLTALYDMAGIWMLAQRPSLRVNIVVVNNGGGRIFKRILQGEAATICQNTHDLNFEPLARLWGLQYECYSDIEHIVSCTKNRLIEIIPDTAQTDAFQKELP